MKTLLIATMLVVSSIGNAAPSKVEMVCGRQALAAGKAIFALNHPRARGIRSSVALVSKAASESGAYFG